MSKIKIKNFGPIKEGFKDADGNEWMDIKKVTVFIGNQGSGKSTVAKLITTFMWIEKALSRGDYDKKYFLRRNKLKNQFLAYFRLENYFSNTPEKPTEIDYRGEAYDIRYYNGIVHIEESTNRDYQLPQIMYVPAERNFIANIKNPRALNLTSDSMIEFVSEFSKSLEEMKGPMRIPINDVDVEYNKQFDTVYLKGKVQEDAYRIKLTEASSGFQSFIPVYLVSWYLSKSVKQQSEDSKELMTSEQRERFRKQVQSIFSNNNLTDEQKRIAISEEAKRFNKTAFINIVEEPEQNLFPESQWELLKSLLKFNNMNEGNKLIITTHSPYIINFLSISIQAGFLKARITEMEAENEKELLGKLRKTISIKSVMASHDAIIYQLNEKDGSIEQLSEYEGIPSDKNYLNQSLRHGNEMFDSLLEIEQEL